MTIYTLHHARSSSGCDVTLTGSYGVIESPAFGVADYNNHLTCTWTIQEAQGRAITLRFDEFITENNFDNVKVRHADVIICYQSVNVLL